MSEFWQIVIKSSIKSFGHRAGSVLGLLGILLGLSLAILSLTIAFKASDLTKLTNDSRLMWPDEIAENIVTSLKFERMSKLTEEVDMAESGIHVPELNIVLVDVTTFRSEKMSFFRNYESIIDGLRRVSSEDSSPLTESTDFEAKKCLLSYLLRFCIPKDSNSETLLFLYNGTCRNSSERNLDFFHLTYPFKNVGLFDSIKTYNRNICSDRQFDTDFTDLLSQVHEKVSGKGYVKKTNSKNTLFTLISDFNHDAKGVGFQPLRKELNKLCDYLDINEVSLICLPTYQNDLSSLNEKTEVVSRTIQEIENAFFSKDRIVYKTDLDDFYRPLTSTEDLTFNDSELEKLKLQVNTLFYPSVIIRRVVSIEGNKELLLDSAYLSSCEYLCLNNQVPKDGLYQYHPKVSCCDNIVTVLLPDEPEIIKKRKLDNVKIILETDDELVQSNASFFLSTDRDRSKTLFIFSFTKKLDEYLLVFIAFGYSLTALILILIPVAMLVVNISALISMRYIEIRLVSRSNNAVKKDDALNNYFGVLVITSIFFMCVTITGIVFLFKSMACIFYVPDFALGWLVSIGSFVLLVFFFVVTLVKRSPGSNLKFNTDEFQVVETLLGLK